MKKDKIQVSHHNHITESFYSMTPFQANIFTTIIFKMKFNDSGVELDSKEIKRMCTKNRSNSLFKENLEKIQVIPVKIFLEKENRYDSIIPFPTLRFDIAKGTVLVKVNEDFEPYIKELKGKFTKYSLDEYLSISKFHSKRLYQLIRQYEFKKKRTIDLDDLKKYMGIAPERYSRYEAFNRRIIKESVAEINEKTSLNLKYKAVKKSNKVISIDFTWTERVIATTFNNSEKVDKAILKAKKNIFVSKSWNKRVDTKIIKLLKDKGEDFTVNLLNELYVNLKEEVKTTLVQYINGMVKNISLVKDEKKEKQVKPKQIKGTKPSIEKQEGLTEEIREPINSELLEFKEEVKKIAEKQLKDKARLRIFNSILRGAKSFNTVNSLIVEYSLNKTIPGTEERALEDLTKKELLEMWRELYFTDSKKGEVVIRKLIEENRRLEGRWRKQEFIKGIQLLK